MWRVIGALLALVVALSILGFVVKAVRFLLIVAIVIAAISVIAGMLTRNKP